MCAPIWAESSRSAYQTLIEEPVPDKFVKLLEELRAKEGKS